MYNIQNQTNKDFLEHPVLKAYIDRSNGFVFIWKLGQHVLEFDVPKYQTNKDFSILVVVY